MSDLTQTSDGDLLRRIGEGDEQAFVALYRRRQGGIFRFALQMSGSRALAEDVTQEVFLVLMHDSRNYDSERGSVAGYLYGIARNLVLDHLEQGRASVPISAEAAEVPNASGELAASADLLGDLTRKETIEAVRQAVLALPAHYREVVVLCDLHGVDYVEAARVLRCPVGTVRSRLHRARGLLLKKLRSGGAAGPALSGLRFLRCAP